MRRINTKEITNAIKELCIEANCNLPQDLKECIEKCAARESNPRAKQIFSQMQQNYTVAQSEQIPICQDTGMAVVFIKIGQEVFLEGELLYDAVQEGVRQGYMQGFLRKSVVADPLRRVNTNDNTPAILYTEIVAGDRVEIELCPKGFGSENMSAICMMTPSMGKEDIVEFVVDTVRKAGGNPCPPTVVGVGIGGTFEYAAYLSKKALLRKMDESAQDPFYAAMEEEILQKINELDIGPQGFGGDISALSVHIEKSATHIAGLPVAVNIGCHVTRHKKFTL